MSIEILKEQIKKAEAVRWKWLPLTVAEVSGALEEIEGLQAKQKTAIHYLAEIDNLKGRLEDAIRALVVKDEFIKRAECERDEALKAKEEAADDYQWAEDRAKKYKARAEEAEKKLADERQYSEWLQGECDKAVDAMEQANSKKAKARREEVGNGEKGKKA